LDLIAIFFTLQSTLKNLKIDGALSCVLHGLTNHASVNGL